MTRDDRLASLEKHRSKVDGCLTDVLDQLAELNLKMRFALSLMRVRKQAKSSLIDPTTNAPQLELMDGYVAYCHGGREAMLVMIEREIREYEAFEEAARAQAHADNGDAGTTRGESGEGGGGSPAGEASGPAPRDPGETTH